MKIVINLIKKTLLKRYEVTVIALTIVDYKYLLNLFKKLLIEGGFVKSTKGFTDCSRL